MLISEPPRTPYDLSFALAGIPVRVHPFFWLVAVLLGSRDPRPLAMLSWVAVLFVSILVHELGHAFVIRYYGWQPEITLYAMGGVASYNPGFTPVASSYGRKGNTAAGQILISLAGPGAGFLLAGLVIAILFATNRSMPFFFGITLGTGPAVSDENVRMLVWYLLFVNIFWGLVNLMPVYPLDGGKIGREILVMLDSRDGVRQSLILSMVTAIGLAVAGFALLGSVYVALMFGYLAYGSYRMLQAYSGGGPYGGGYGGGRPW